MPCPLRTPPGAGRFCYHLLPYSLQYLYIASMVVGASKQADMPLASLRSQAEPRGVFGLFPPKSVSYHSLPISTPLN